MRHFSCPKWFDKITRCTLAIKKRNRKNIKYVIPLIAVFVVIVTGLSYICPVQKSSRSKDIKTYDTIENKAAAQLQEVYLTKGNKALEAMEYKMAVEYLEKAAERGNTEAMYILASIYETGEFEVPENRTLALKWYKKAAESGDADAMYRMCGIYSEIYYDIQTGDEDEFNSWGITPNSTVVEFWAKKAFVAYRKAADAGDSWAMDMLGDMYKRGEGVEQNKMEAFKWYRKAADAGNATAMNDLSYMYESNYDIRVDEAEDIRRKSRYEDAQLKAIVTYWKNRYYEARLKENLENVGNCRKKVELIIDAAGRQFDKESATGVNVELGDAYGNYCGILDKEKQKIYNKLMTVLPDNEKRELHNRQSRWEKYVEKQSGNIDRRASKLSGGGSMDWVASSAWSLGETKQRLRYLADYYDKVSGK